MSSAEGSLVSRIARATAGAFALCLEASSSLAEPFAYVPHADGGGLSVIDTATDTVVDTIAIGTAGASVAVDALTSRAYVLHQSPRSLTVIDTATNTVVTAFPVCATSTSNFVGANGVALDASGAVAYVGCNFPAVVDAIDTTTFAVTPVTVGNGVEFVQGLAVDRAGTRIYAQLRDDFGTIGRLIVVDATTLTPIDDITMQTDYAFSITAPLGLAVDCSGSRVIIPHPGAPDLRLLDSTTTAVTHVTLPSPSRAAAVNRAGTIIYATMSNGAVAVVSGTSAALIDTIPVGSDPRGLSLDPTETRLYVANRGGDAVAVIDTATHAVVGSIPVGDGPIAVGNFIAPVFDCAFESCDDGDPCTQDTCSTVAGCAHEVAPRPGCRAAGKSILLIEDDGDDEEDKLIWKWLKGEATSQGDFADPTAATDYTLCVYAGTSSVLAATVDADPLRWKEIGSTGYKYTDSTASDSGIKRIVLSGKGAGKSKVLVKGKGVALPDPALELPEPVTAQLVKSDSPLCWGAEYAGAAITDNTSGRFRAKVK